MFFTKKNKEKEKSLKEQWEEKIDILRAEAIKACHFKYEKIYERRLDYHLSKAMSYMWYEEPIYTNECVGLKISFLDEKLWNLKFYLDSSIYKLFDNFWYDWESFKINWNSKAEQEIARHFTLIEKEKKRQEKETRDKLERERQKKEDELYLKKLQELEWIKPLDKDLKHSIKSAERLIEIADSIKKLTNEAKKIRGKFIL